MYFQCYFMILTIIVLCMSLLHDLPIYKPLFNLNFNRIRTDTSKYGILDSPKSHTYGLGLPTIINHKGLGIFLFVLMGPPPIIKSFC